MTVVSVKRVARRVLDLSEATSRLPRRPVRCFVAKELPMRPDRMTTKSQEAFQRISPAVSASFQNQKG